jgi:opacity protein-like surface antigen
MRFFSILSTLALMALPIPCAFAADDLINGSGDGSDLPFNRVLPKIGADAYKSVEVGSGWYIRGDIGYNINGKHNAEKYTLAPVNYENNYKDAITFGAGFGYRLNEMIRFDAGAEQIFSSEFSSRRAVAPEGPCKGRALLVDPPGWGPADIENCIREDKASYKAFITMANAYVDLGAYNGITPFLGLGIGAARVSFKEEIGNINCVPVSAAMNAEGCVPRGVADQPAPNIPYTQIGHYNSDTDWRLAYALSAGASYDLSKNLKLDTIYKFTKIGSGSGIPYGATPGSSMARDGFSLHQVKMGLRYEIW